MIKNARVRKKSSRWRSSSSSSSSSMEMIMDEEIRNNEMEEVEIRRLEEEEEDFDKKNITNAIWEEEVLEKMRNAMRVERVRAISRFELMGVTDEEEIRNAMELEISRLKEEDEIRTNRYLMEIQVEKIRDMRSEFVLHISPLEIIDNPCDQDFTNVVAENINQIELVIILIDHHSIHQYWTPRSTTTTTTSSYSCQHHDDYLHPRDGDDEEMILAACRPLLDSPRRLKIILDRGGVFADPSKKEEGVFAEESDDLLLGSLDVLFEYGILPTHQHLEDLKTSITRSISEAKPHVVTVKPPPPKRVRICVQVSWVQKQYYGSAEDAIFDAAVHDAREASACEMTDTDAFYKA